METPGAQPTITHNVADQPEDAMQAIVLGSVAYRVLHHAPCPVLVTR